MAENNNNDKQMQNIQSALNNQGQQIDSIKNTLLHHEQGKTYPKNPDGSYSPNRTINDNSLNNKEIAQQNQQQTSFFRQILDVLGSIKTSLSAQGQNIKKLLDKKQEFIVDQKTINKLTDNLSNRLKGDVNSFLKTDPYAKRFFNTIDNLNKKLSSDLLDVNLSQATINSLNEKLSTTFSPTVKDIDLAPLIKEKLSTTVLDLSSIITTDKIKQIDLTNLISSSFKFDPTTITNSIQEKYISVLDNLKLNDINLTDKIAEKINIGDLTETIASKINIEDFSKNITNKIQVNIDNKQLADNLNSSFEKLNNTLNEKLQANSLSQISQLTEQLGKRDQIFTQKLEYIAKGVDSISTSMTNQKQNIVEQQAEELTTTTENANRNDITTQIQRGLQNYFDDKNSKLYQNLTNSIDKSLGKYIGNNDNKGTTTKQITKAIDSNKKYNNNKSLIDENFDIAIDKATGNIQFLMKDLMEKEVQQPALTIDNYKKEAPRKEQSSFVTNPISIPAPQIPTSSNSVQLKPFKPITIEPPEINVKPYTEPITIQPPQVEIGKLQTIKLDTPDFEIDKEIPKTISIEAPQIQVNNIPKVLTIEAPKFEIDKDTIIPPHINIADYEERTIAPPPVKFTPFTKEQTYELIPPPVSILPYTEQQKIAPPEVEFEKYETKTIAPPPVEFNEYEAIFKELPKLTVTLPKPIINDRQFNKTLSNITLPKPTIDQKNLDNVLKNISLPKPEIEIGKIDPITIDAPQFKFKEDQQIPKTISIDAPTFDINGEVPKTITIDAPEFKFKEGEDISKTITINAPQIEVDKDTIKPVKIEFPGFEISNKEQINKPITIKGEGVKGSEKGESVKAEPLKSEEKTISIPINKESLGTNNNYKVNRSMIKDQALQVGEKTAGPDRQRTQFFNNLMNFLTEDGQITSLDDVFVKNNKSLKKAIGKIGGKGKEEGSGDQEQKKGWFRRLFSRKERPQKAAGHQNRSLGGDTNEGGGFSLGGLGKMLGLGGGGAAAAGGLTLGSSLLIAAAALGTPMIYGAVHADEWMEQNGNETGQTATGSKYADAGFATFTRLIPGNLKRTWDWLTGQGFDNEFNDRYTTAEILAEAQQGAVIAQELQNQRFNKKADEILEKVKENSWYSGEKAWIDNNNAKINKKLAQNNITLTRDTNFETLTPEQTKLVSSSIQQRSDLLDYQQKNIEFQMKSFGNSNWIYKINDQNVSGQEKNKYGLAFSNIIERIPDSDILTWDKKIKTEEEKDYIPPSLRLQKIIKKVPLAEIDLDTLTNFQQQLQLASSPLVIQDEKWDEALKSLSQNELNGGNLPHFKNIILRMHNNQMLKNINEEILRRDEDRINRNVQQDLRRTLKRKNQSLQATPSSPPGSATETANTAIKTETEAKATPPALPPGAIPTDTKEGETGPYATDKKEQNQSGNQVTYIILGSDKNIVPDRRNQMPA